MICTLCAYEIIDLYSPAFKHLELQLEKLSNVFKRKQNDELWVEKVVKNYRSFSSFFKSTNQKSVWVVC